MGPTFNVHQILKLQYHVDIALFPQKKPQKNIAIYCSSTCGVPTNLFLFKLTQNMVENWLNVHICYMVNDTFPSMWMIVTSHVYNSPGIVSRQGQAKCMKSTLQFE